MTFRKYELAWSDSKHEQPQSRQWKREEEEEDEDEEEEDEDEEDEEEEDEEEEEKEEEEEEDEERQGIKKNIFLPILLTFPYFCFRSGQACNQNITLWMLSDWIAVR